MIAGMIAGAVNLRLFSLSLSPSLSPSLSLSLYMHIYIYISTHILRPCETKRENGESETQSTRQIAQH